MLMSVNDLFIVCDSIDLKVGLGSQLVKPWSHLAQTSGHCGSLS